MKATGHTARNINMRDRVKEKLDADPQILTEKYGLTAPFKDKWGHHVRELRDLLNTSGVVEFLAEHFRVSDDIAKETKDRKNDPQVDAPLAFVQGGSDFNCPYCKTGHDLEWTTEYGEPLDGDYVIQCINEEGCNRTFPVSVDSSPRYSVG